MTDEASSHRPVLVYDGDCGFCRRWIERWRLATGDRVEYVAYQDCADRFPGLGEDDFRRSVVLVEPAGQVWRGAEAVFRALARAPGGGRLAARYRRSRAFASSAEALYRLVARHRAAFSAVDRFATGQARRGGFSRWLFLRLLGVVYFFAFVSLRSQIVGLIGKDGILPAADLLPAVREALGGAAFWRLPTLFWLGASDAALRGVSSAGAALALALVAGLAPAPVLALLWAFYLSLEKVGGDFLGFQWDALLLETGFLAIFAAPLSLRDRPSAPPAPPAIVFLLRWLLFRLMFSSGAVKLSSGDPTWRGLTALTVHYETQPLPTWIGWYAHQLPPWFHELSAAIMFAIELGAPALIFLGRRPRLVALTAFTALQLLIAATGNYGFFNLLTLALCVLLVDEELWPERRTRRATTEPLRPARAWSPWVVLPLSAAIFLATLVQTLALTRIGLRWPAPLVRLHRAASTFDLVSGYGLFAVMTTTRPEIVVEGSDDGVEWRPYGFRWKPGDPARAPAFVEPFQPRLDWQMWFAALGSYRDSPWFTNFLVRLLQGSRPVLSLLADDPFPGRPPRRIRGVLWNYRFTTWAERRATGDWWRRERLGPYSPEISLRAPPGGD